MRILASLLLLGVLTASNAESTIAHLGIIWRFAVLSWDDPTTQLHDNIASQGSVCSDPSGEASHVARWSPPGKRAVTVASDASRHAYLFAVAPTRAPPSR